MSKFNFEKGMTPTEEVLDRIRGGPRARLQEFCADYNMEYVWLMELMLAIAEGRKGREDVHLPFESDTLQDLWPDFEMVTGVTVSLEVRNAYFHCSC